MDAAHFHLLVNHLPIIGAFLSVPLAILSLWRRGDPGARLATALVLVLSGSGAVAANLSGEPAEERVEDLPDVAEPWIEEHEERAEAATVLSVLTALLAIGGLVVTGRKAQLATPVGTAVLAMSVVTAGSMAWTGAAGGQIRHSEIRGDQPLVRAEAAGDEDGDDD